MKIILYTAEYLNLKAPAEGFVNGGWYQGHQYYLGTFSEQGVIHPLYEIFSNNQIEIK